MRARSAPPLAGTRAFFSEHLGRQADDVWGLVLIVGGIICALGMFGDLTGPFGRVVRLGFGALLGLAQVVVPFALIAVGYVLVRGRPREEPVRVTIGWLFVGCAGTGLLHLLRGAPRFGRPLPEFRRAGGLVGAALGAPLRSVIGVWGAALVLAVVLGLGLLILARTRVRDAVNRAADGVRPVGAAGRAAGQAAGRAAGRGVASLFTLERRQASGRLMDPTYDDDIDGGDAAGAAGAGDATEREVADEQRSTRSRGGRRGRARGTRVFDEPLDDWTDDDDTALAHEADDGSTGAVGTGPSEPSTAVPERAPVAIRTPSAPQWHEEQPAAEAQALPGLDERTPAVVWKLPSLTLLKKGKPFEVDKRAVEATGRVLEDALDAHGVQTRLVGMTVGPTVTRYELELAPGVKVAKVTALHKDIAYAMAAADVRVLAPIPGKSAVGVEVPNKTRQLVAVADVLATKEARALEAPLGVAIGKDINGEPVMVDLARMPHVLVAGTTGSGKSSCINSLLCSILTRATPDDVRMILIDPKMVELSQYNGLPHLLTAVVTNPKKAANALAWAVDEMERRYELLAQLGFRDITGYNAAVLRGDFDDPYADDPAGGIGLPAAPRYEKFPFILVVVDELADLMMVAARDVEESICRIAQKARAVGIHLVIATQRPSVNVITGLIKANVPSRFAFAVSSLTDSRVILDQPGAERLIGQGDMLMSTVSSPNAQRVQGNFVSEEEIRKVVAFWKKQAPAAAAATAATAATRRSSQPDGPADDPTDEPGARLATTGWVQPSIPGTETTGFGVGPIGPGAPSGGAGGSAEDELAAEMSRPLATFDDITADRAESATADDDGDELLDAAMELIVRSQLGSTSMLQRKLRVGFSRAGRIMDLLEQRGVVGPSTGSKARDVLMTVPELEAALARRRG